MLQQIPSATLPDTLGPWVAVVAFGAYHGLNPGMGWLFALSLGLQQGSQRAIWVSLLPIAAGHAASLVLVAMLILAGFHFIPAGLLQMATGVLLIAFGVYKIFRYYRHPRWVGMKVGLVDLTWWSFLMATAHGAGLMIAPALISIAATEGAHHHHQVSAGGAGVLLGILAHTLAMLTVMSAVAWAVYRHLGLAVLRQKWINFDLIWAVALLLVGALSLIGGSYLGSRV
ncbi:MAG: hypothetical protein EHM61_09620 [Acidobacteria bacterium]|nr:MAG: hypothetical protein EHM61_09620 [Acidobacteriota bacterium]